MGARPEHLQGTDLGLDMSEFGDASNRVTFSKFHGGETVTTEGYSCTEFRQKKSGELSGLMLFDLSTDPDENSNVANSSEYSEVRVFLSLKLDSLRHLTKGL